MSAIFGIIRFDGAPVAPRDMERMATAVAHRGPDGRKFIVDGAVALGHCALHVTREDRFDVQPMRDRASGVTVVADARLDNRAELAGAFGLSPAELTGLPDSALILRAYAKWGNDCAQYLLGDFAFAVWDARAQRLVLARDHMGQRCVHYHHASGMLVFATEMRALWTHAAVPRVLSEAGIARALLVVQGAPEGETMFEGIRGLPGASVLSIGIDGSIDLRRYWEPHADPAHEGRDEAYYVAAYREVLGEAVACRIRRNTRRPGLIFSGGYDSAAIAGLAGPALQQSGHTLVAAASVMPADYRGTIRHARRWVELCARDMPHLDVRYVTREGKSVLTGLERAFLESGSRVGSYHFVYEELFTTIADAGARVVMHGRGGDQTLNPRGQTALARFLVTGRWRRFATELRQHHRLTGEPPWRTVRNTISMLLPRRMADFTRRARTGLATAGHQMPINPEFVHRLVADGVVGNERALERPHDQVDMRAALLAGLQSFSRATGSFLGTTAAHRGLEFTAPFLDKRVVELALAVPQDLYVKNGRNRYLARVALKDVYPAEFQTRGQLNDDPIPDFQRMASSATPQLLEEISRMERSADLTRYVDFSKLRSLLGARGSDDHNSGWEPETHAALLAFTVARYVEWFRRNNR